VTPAGCREFYRHGHSVFVERGAGIGSGFPDGDYESAGARLCASAAEVFQQAGLIVKVKEPLPEEFDYIREHHIIFTFFHFASDRNLTDAMRSSGATCIAYETVEAPDGS
ncbi:MAG: alanine dehydrogenase, partial [Leptospiraceae bacterium]|nr:alanine dehydrogenase [Leptospiraceae bacterium]